MHVGFALFVLMVYVKWFELIQFASMVRNHTFLKNPFSCYSLNVSQQFDKVKNNFLLKKIVIRKKALR
jgi:hypothetical protein